jgi:hypothetical protein
MQNKKRTPLIIILISAFIMLIAVILYGIFAFIDFITGKKTMKL